MSSVTLRAHFNGTQVVLDEPFSLEPNVKLLVTVLPSEAGFEREDWLLLSAQGLEAAYGDDEPEYLLADPASHSSHGGIAKRLDMTTDIPPNQ